MRRTAMEAGKKPVDKEYEYFKEYFVDNFRQENKLEQGSVIKEMLENQVGGKWLVYPGDDRKDYLALNVKWLGMGNWDAFNKGGRAEEAGINQEQYYDNLQEQKEYYFQDVSDHWKKVYGVPMYAMGRSDGYWGVNLGDLVYNSFTDMFELNDEKLRQLYDTVKEEDDDPYDQAYEAYLYVSDEEIPQYFRFKESFCQFLETLQNDIESDSNNWESQKWNDQEFERLAI